MFLRNLLADVASLRRPVTAASLVALAVSILSPFGVEVDVEQVSAALVAVGVVFAYVEHRA